MAAEDTISVCVGNYGYYNEGELRDQWIELPKSEREIRDFLRDNGLYDSLHEETYISDYDGIPFGLPYGGAFTEYTSLDDLNLLARAMVEADHDSLERLAGAFEAGADYPGTVLGLTNLVAQADEVPYTPYIVEGSTPQESYALSYVDQIGGAENLDRDDLESYFDYESYGRGLLAGGDVRAGAQGWCWSDMEGPDLEAYGSVEAACEDMAVDVGDECEIYLEDEHGMEAGKARLGDLSAEDVRTQLSRAIGYAPQGGAPAEGELAADERRLLAMCKELTEFDCEAVETYVDAKAPSATIDEWASAVAQHMEIDYRQYDSDALDTETCVGESVVSDLGDVMDLDTDTLAQHFDYERYGRDQEHEGLVTCGENGYLDGFMPDDEAYSKEVLEALYPADSGEPAPDPGHAVLEEMRESVRSGGLSSPARLADWAQRLSEAADAHRDAGMSPDVWATEGAVSARLGELASDGLEISPRGIDTWRQNVATLADQLGQSLDHDGDERLGERATTTPVLYLAGVVSRPEGTVKEELHPFAIWSVASTTPEGAVENLEQMHGPMSIEKGAGGSACLVATEGMSSGTSFEVRGIDAGTAVSMHRMVKEAVPGVEGLDGVKDAAAGIAFDHGTALDAPALSRALDGAMGSTLAVMRGAVESGRQVNPEELMRWAGFVANDSARHLADGRPPSVWAAEHNLSGWLRELGSKDEPVDAGKLSYATKALSDVIQSLGADVRESGDRGAWAPDGEPIEDVVWANKGKAAGVPDEPKPAPSVSSGGVRSSPTISALTPKLERDSEVGGQVREASVDRDRAR